MSAQPPIAGSPPAFDYVWLWGVPDDGAIKLRSRSDLGRPDLIWPGTAEIWAHADASWKQKPRLYLPRYSAEGFPLPLFNNAINHIADADLYRGALMIAAEVVRVCKTPCFNLPVAVQATTRDRTSQTLQGIEGLVAPKAVRFQAKHPRDFLATFEQYGFDYPVLVRIAGTHAGQSQILIETADHWDQIYSIPWAGADLYMTQFVDFVSSDGRYRKIRLVFVGGQVFVRHRIVGEGWKVHSAKRLQAEIEEELAWIGAFRTEWAPARQPIFEEVVKRIGLDWFGMDCGEMADGRLLLFEVNASMGVMRPTPSFEAEFAPLITEISDALFGLLADPTRWRAAQAALAA